MERARREQNAFDDGDVREASAKLHERFWHVFRCPNTLALEQAFHASVAAAARGADVLELGCLDGDLVPKLARARARRVVGIDISGKGVARARERFGGTAEFQVMDAHRLAFADRSFDLVCGKAVLHHLDLEVAVDEAARVLRPGGAAIFMEPIRGNPLGGLLRRWTSEARTADELPLSRAQIRDVDARFGGNSHRFGNLLSVPVAMLTSRWLANPLNRPLLLAHRMDLALERTPLRHWMRFAVLSWHHPAPRTGAPE